MSIELREVKISTKDSLGGLFLEVADYLREQARGGVTMRVASWNFNALDEKYVILREVTGND